MKNRCISALLTFVILLPGLSSAQDGSRTGAFRQERHRFIEELNLSQEQKSALKKFKESRGENKQAFEKMRTARKDLSEAIKNSSASDTEVMKQVELVNQNFAEMNRARVSRMLELRKILGADKFAKLTEKIKERREQGGRPGMFGRGEKDGDETRYDGERNNGQEGPGGRRFGPGWLRSQDGQRPNLGSRFGRPNRPEEGRQRQGTHNLPDDAEIEDGGF